MRRVTKSQAAREWKVSPAAVSKYVAAGMPVRGDGYLDFEFADQWRRDYVSPSRSGSYKARQRKTESAAGAQAQESADGAAGADALTARLNEAWVAGYVKARTNLRRALPPLLAEMGPAGVSDRIRAFALMDGLLQVWFDNEANRSDALPQLDFSAFENPKAAQEIYWQMHDFVTTVDQAKAGAR